MKTIVPSTFTGKVKLELDSVIGLKTRIAISSMLGWIRHPIYRLRMSKKINTMAHFAVEKQYIDLKNVNYWKKLYKKMINEFGTTAYTEVPGFFFESDIKRVYSGKEALRYEKDSSEPIVICVLKDEIFRLPCIISHYRDVLGVKCFAFLDNGSTDGCLEYLKSQNDVLLYTASEQYSSQQKSAWANRIMDELGLNRWYLIIDADECFVYPGYENKSLKEYTQLLNKKKIDVVRALYVEMYPRGDLFSLEENEDFRSIYCWFDPDSDEYLYVPESYSIWGGLHGRVFDIPWVDRTGVRLIKPEGKRMGFTAHKIVPFFEGALAEFGLVILHYKFLPGDMEKIDKIIHDGRYAHGSKFYKIYRKTFVEKGIRSFWNENSRQWMGSESFKYLPMIREVVDE